jgi:hypothetical protein
LGFKIDVQLIMLPDERIDPGVSRTPMAVAGFQIESPSMHRAPHGTSSFLICLDQRPADQGALAVRAGIIQGIESVGDMKYGNIDPLDRDELALSRNDFRDFRQKRHAA